MAENKFPTPAKLKNNFVITKEHQGLRLDKFLISRGLNFSLIQKLVRKKLIKVNSQRTEIAQRLEDGDSVTIFANLDLVEKVKTVKSVSSDVIAQLKNSIIYKDENLIAINKKSGLAVQGGSGIKTSVDDILAHLKFDEVQTPKLVHRLDKDTSGILLIARNRIAADLLTESFREKTIKKTYLALVKGWPRQDSGVIDIPLCKKYHGIIEKVYPDKVNGKRAVTNYTVIKYFEREDCSLVECNPITGRTHQIRVHLKEIGHPIIGDFKYGNKNMDFKGLGLSKRLYLHAFKIEITDFFGKDIEISTHKNLPQNKYLSVFL